MASNVNVLCPNGRRQTVKVSPNTRILEVIEIVCKKQKFNADDYNLKHQRTILDVQVPFRYANLINNAKLELVKADVSRSLSGSTMVALQLSTGERLQHSFDSTISLWDILQHWEGQSSDR
ncbi:tether containing UBX domain for GLUT4-like [Strongylocentrotus purpuratus]|uniref:TUG ubiquitin-like domain-containing protein n=1 Tax=Strongylocentrotus purpuratus TaxID=7668 RepID=A0A7M7P7A5_STRPU|nr:tether containing UBX domain for GLUT4-like [Strongylocentrotus purpuratus]